MNYVWTINELFSYPQADGYSDVVFGAAYTLTGTDGDYSASQSGQVPFPPPEKPFTPYPKLTQDQVIVWVQDALTPEGVSALESQIAQMVSEQQNPTVVVNPLPW
jgi:hypothetical protein